MGRKIGVWQPEIFLKKPVTLLYCISFSFHLQNLKNQIMTTNLVIIFWNFLLYNCSLFLSRECEMKMKKKKEA